MLGLLRESCCEVIRRPVALLKCFWLTVVLECVVFSLVLARLITPYEALVGMLFVLVVSITPGAVMWHRHVIADQKASLLPRLPDLFSLAYLFKFAVATIVFSTIKKIASSLASDVILPLYGLAAGGVLPEDPTIVGLALAVLGEVIAVLAFVLIFGRLMLWLPEGTLDLAQRGFRETWSPQGRADFLSALGLVYVAPALISAFATWISPEELNWLWVVQLFSAIAATVVGLSLLTVAYRRNLQHADAKIIVKSM